MTSQKYRSLAIIIVIAFSVLSRAQWLFDNNAPLGGDEMVYDNLARRVLAGQGFTLETGEPTAWRTPGFPMLLGLIYSMTGVDPDRARLVLVFFTSLTSLAVFWFCLLLTKDLSCAVLSSLSWSALLTTNRLAGLLIGESSAALVFVFGLALVVLASSRNSTMLAGAAGVLLGLSVLIRAYLILAVLGPLIWLSLESKKRIAAVFALFVMVVIGGWMTRNLLTLGSLTLSTQGPQEMWCGNNAWARGAWPGEWMREDSEQRQYLRSKYPEFDGAGEVARSRIFTREAIYQLTHHPTHVLWLAPRKIAIYFSHLSFWGKDWVYLTLLPFSLIGAVYFWKSPDLRHVLWLIAGPIIAVMLVCLLTFGDPRFRHPVDPLVAILSSVGIVYAIRLLIALRDRRRRLSKKPDGICE